MRILFAIFVFIVIANVISSHASAQTLNTVQAFNFGESIIINNNATYSLSVAANTAISHDPEFVILSNPVPGIYRVTGGIPFDTIVSVNVMVNTQPAAMGGNFTIDNIDVDAPAQLDASGEAIIRIGARLNTSGTGVNYTSSTAFNGSLDVTVNY